MNFALKWTFLVYFATHIPITLSLDMQILFGQFYPPVFRQLYLFYTTTFQDHLLVEKPIWLQSFIFLEAFFQLPFFFFAIYGLYHERKWIRFPSVVYGAHVATTVFPILAEAAFSGKNSLEEQLVLFGFYMPYFVIPLLLVYVMIFDESFGKKKSN